MYVGIFALQEVVSQKGSLVQQLSAVIGTGLDRFFVVFY